MRDFIFRYRGWLFIPAAIIMLILARPTVSSLIVGLIVSFVIGEGIRIWAVGYSGVTTRGSELEAPKLITAGPYALIRNPLYMGNLMSWLGFCIAASGAAPIWVKAVIFLSMLVSYIIIYGNIIPHEEAFLEKEFKEPFIEYKKHVPAMLPRLKPYEKQNGKWDPGVIISAESHTIIMLIVVSIVLVVKYMYLINR
ncbi:MAG: isoprenylcysteine carboxylmethyltransferase family protein [Candidatus Eremiobacteraeota bacterium]|nr:isoprenylcysteine carboxylmethyltransferase family protein [Candidatus Eremiobacteraeota bacterium]